MQKGPFYMGEDVTVDAIDLVDSLSKEYVLTKMMPSAEVRRPTLEDAIISHLP